MLLSNPNPHPRKSTARVLWVLFSIFVVYGTTFPFSFEHGEHAISALLNRISWSPRSSIPDMLQNIILFTPFGFLGYFSLIYKSSRKRKVAVVLLGSLLSASVELLQIFSWQRWPALSDVIFNTAGTAVGLSLGILLKKSVFGFKTNPTSRRFLDAPSAFPAVVFLILLVAGCWVPFDFSLEKGHDWERYRALAYLPWQFSLPDDDLFACIQFLLATLFVCRVLKEGGWFQPAKIGIMAMIALGIVLEATQIIVISRYPEIQDVLVATFGTLLGGLVFLFPGFRERPWMWSATSAFGIFLSAAVRGLHPFRFRGSPSGFNWILFLPQHAMTTAATLGEFLANGMLYFPVGFLLTYFFPGSKRVFWVALVLAGFMALALETVQGWVVGGYSDITDVLGAALGSMVGSLVLTRGWPAFTLYMRQDEDDQV